MAPKKRKATKGLAVAKMSPVAFPPVIPISQIKSAKALESKSIEVIIS